MGILNPGETIESFLSSEPGEGIDASGDFIIAALDVGNNITEINEENNIVVSDQIESGNIATGGCTTATALSTGKTPLIGIFIMFIPLIVIFFKLKLKNYRRIKINRKSLT